MYSLHLQKHQQPDSIKLNAESGYVKKHKSEIQILNERDGRTRVMRDERTMEKRGQERGENWRDGRLRVGMNEWRGKNEG